MLQANQSDLPLAEYVKRHRQKDMAQRKVHGLPDRSNPTKNSPGLNLVQNSDLGFSRRLNLVGQPD